MCNSYGLEHPITVINQAFSEIQIPLIFPTGAPNLEPRPLIRPTELAPIVRNSAAGVELVSRRWGFKPPQPKAGPVINFRGEGRRFSAASRCLIPASYFFEFTGEKYPKTKWRFTLEGEPFLCIAGLWRPEAPDCPEAWTMLTVDPGPDVAPYHNRQIVVLRREQWADWLGGGAEAGLVRPLPAGSLQVEQS